MCIRDRPYIELSKKTGIFNDINYITNHIILNTIVSEYKNKSVNIDTQYVLRKIKDSTKIEVMDKEAIDIDDVERLVNMIKAQSKEIDSVKKMSAQKTFKHTPNAPKVAEVKKNLSQDERIFAIFNKAKNK